MNTPQNDGGAAFPSKMLVNRFATEETAQQLIGADGMSLRDWFAGQALPSAIEWHRLTGKDEIYEDGFVGIHQQPCLPDYDSGNKEIARCCYAIAEAMIAERNELLQP